MNLSILLDENDVQLPIKTVISNDPLIVMSLVVGARKRKARNTAGNDSRFVRKNPALYVLAKNLQDFPAVS